MDQGKGGRRGSRAAEELILRAVAAHADSLLRTARRHSMCIEDAQDAYQRTLEILMTRADRLDPERVGGWLHVVVKREAQAICRARKKHMSSADPDVEGHEARRLPSPEDRALASDLIGRSAEALQRLKPQELRALWLKAEGHSYNEIAVLTGWSYTKVNRCLTEGRRSFLERFAAIESGAECERWMPTISALVDGEATPEQIVEMRPHLRNCAGCRAALRALRDSSAPLSAVLPVPLTVVASGGGEQLTHWFARAYEALAGGLQDRAMHSMAKAQAAIEAAAGGKVAAVAASAAAAAGGGYVTVERTVNQVHGDRASASARHDPPRRASNVAATRVAVTPPPAAPPLSERPVQVPTSKPAKSAPAPSAKTPSEFDPSPSPRSVRAASVTAASASSEASTVSRASSTSAPVQDSSSATTGEFAP